MEENTDKPEAIKDIAVINATRKHGVIYVVIVLRLTVLIAERNLAR